MAEKKIKIIAENRKARHDFTIHETYEAGIELTGTEVKSLRAGKANLKDSYAQITKTAEVYVYNLHISPYDQGNRFNHEPLRNRRLLLHREEIRRLIGKVKEKGYALVPLKMYLTHGLVKWSWPWRQAKSCTINVRISPAKTPSARWNAP